MKIAYPILVICLTFFSLFGYAQGEAVNSPVVETILPDGTKQSYETWSAALKFANKQALCTIRLLEDIDLGKLSAIQYVHQELVLDLNGHTLSAEGTSKYYRFLSPRYEESFLTIKSAPRGGIVFSSSGSSNLQAIYAPKGAVSLHNVQIDCFN